MTTRGFLGRMAIFAVPVAIYVALVAAVDPYGYFGDGAVSVEARRNVAYELNYAMWKILEYRADPAPRIMLGDSRMMSLDEDVVSDASGERWDNLAYGGGSMREAVETYRIAARLTDLEEVAIGVNLNLWNGADAKNRVAEVRGAIANPGLYLVNRNVLKSTVKLLPALFGSMPERVGRPPMDRDAFWDHQLSVTAEATFGSWRDPVEYRREISEIAAECRARGTRLFFVVFPSHSDLQAVVRDHDLQDEHARMLEDLSALGEVYDFELENDLTADRDRYRDPYHFDEPTMRLIVDRIWGDGEGYVIRRGASS